MDYRNSCQSNLNLIKSSEEQEERIKKLTLMVDEKE